MKSLADFVQASPMSLSPQTAGPAPTPPSGGAMLQERSPSSSSALSPPSRNTVPALNAAVAGLVAATRSQDAQAQDRSRTAFAASPRSSPSGSGVVSQPPRQASDQPRSRLGSQAVHQPLPSEETPRSAALSREGIDNLLARPRAASAASGSPFAGGVHQPSPVGSGSVPGSASVHEERRGQTTPGQASRTPQSRTEVVSLGGSSELIFDRFGAASQPMARTMPRPCGGGTPSPQDTAFAADGSDLTPSQVPQARTVPGFSPTFRSAFASPVDALGSSFGAQALSPGAADETRSAELEQLIRQSVHS